jgi:hypothetical protein
MRGCWLTQSEINLRVPRNIVPTVFTLRISISRDFLEKHSGFVGFGSFWKMNIVSNSVVLHHVRIRLSTVVFALQN